MKSFEPKPDFITRLTLLTNPDICNAHCPLCFLNQRGKKLGKGEMPFRIAEENIVRYASTLREVIPSTMGEPLLYKNFEELLELCERLKIPINLTTNGTFPGYSSKKKMKRLLLACNDIKISAMGFSEETFSSSMRGISFSFWKENVLRLLAEKSLWASEGILNTASISLQVTLHKKSIGEWEKILDFASAFGISRIKWNPVVFLLNAGSDLKNEFAVSSGELENVREAIRRESANCGVRAEGSLFFSEEKTGFSSFQKGAPLEKFSEGARGREKNCRFARELWIFPDGSTETCPNPERRFGDKKRADCRDCPMK